MVDSKDPVAVEGLPIHDCSVLLVNSSTQDDRMHQFSKLVPVSKVYCMPVWALDELSTIAFLYPEAARV